MSESGEVRKLHGLEAVLAAAQHLSDEETKILQAALAWDVEDMEGVPIKHPTLTQIDKELHDQRRDLAECYRLTGADPSDGSDAMLAREALDEVRRFRKEYDELEEAIAKVGEALDRIDAPQGATYAERIDRLYRELTGRAPGYGQQRAEGKVPAGTRELRIVLDRISHPQAPPEFRFIELEDQDGRSVGGFPVRESWRNPFYEITIPYGRDDAWVTEVVYQAAGAATRPLLEDHPDYVFPAERVQEAVAYLLETFGVPRACTGCQEEQLEHGRKEVGAVEDRGDDAPTDPL